MRGGGQTRGGRRRGAQVPGRVGTKRPSGDGATCHFHQSCTFNAVYLPNMNHVSFVAYVSIVHCDYQSIVLWWSTCRRSHPLTHHVHAGISPLPNLMLHCAHQQLSPPQLVLSLPTYVCRWSMSAYGSAAAMSECPPPPLGQGVDGRFLYSPLEGEVVTIVHGAL